MPGPGVHSGGDLRDISGLQPTDEGVVLKSSIGRLRVVGVVEGVSFLLLLGVAMPLKYMAGMPQMVSVVGMAHGLLWLLFVAAVLDVRMRRGWPVSRVAVALLSSVLPFGPFVLDPSLRREQEQDSQEDAAALAA
jgi:integral membrane protein